MRLSPRCMAFIHSNESSKKYEFFWDLRALSFISSTQKGTHFWRPIPLWAENMRNIVFRVFVLLSFGLMCCVLQAVHGEPRAGSRESARGHRAGASRLAIRWTGNGRVYNLLSHGSEYLPSRRRGNVDASRPALVIRESNDTVPSRTSARAKSNSGLAQREPTQTDSGDVMMADNPYDPYKSIRNELYNPYYNYYDSYYQPRSRNRVRPGYETRYFQYGKSMAEVYVHVQMRKP